MTASADPVGAVAAGAHRSTMDDTEGSGRLVCLVAR
jgi:hypothetical protein